ncbi:MAG: hypothetical protein H2212_12820 [Ruminococcus sp.]|nr:hypothetical protein [Ruminococcus sp.]
MAGSKMKRRFPSQGVEKVCCLCGGIIDGEYDYIKTRRKSEFYFHKDMNCMGRKKKNDAS